MEDRFKKQLLAHRELLEKQSPSQGAWEKINARLKPKPKTALLTSYRLPIGIAAVLAIAFCTWLLTTDQHKHTPVIRLAGRPAVPPLAPQVTADKVQEDFATQLKLRKYIGKLSVKLLAKRKQLASLAANHPAIEKAVQQSTKDLSRSYKELEQTLGQQVNPEQVLQIMSTNLKLQEKLLSNQLALFQTLKEQENESR
ncbi:hypothetical protein [Pedobacter sp. ASV28]|uniref:hypothetical protein n=1 Tax=Pedobacter sp. ASV28 TaxID=2795123 RepID=UPI0018EBEE05|nr:hypothetical protein [Pedobacter sp. ASV28]